MAFGAKDWETYFGKKAGEEPPLPVGIDTILDSRCPFWPRKKVRDTHLLVLVPETVDGKPFTLNLLGELIQSPKAGSYGTKYRCYDDAVKQALGNLSSSRSYWVLMTRDVLPNSRGKTYEDQKKLVAEHAQRESLPYEIPRALEAATAILLHHARTGERLQRCSLYLHPVPREGK